MRKPEKVEGTAYSYIRFSAKEQERGDSLRRQTDLRDRWLALHPAVKLDDSLKLQDLGVSAFRGKHRSGDAFALGQFVKLVETGRVAKGSFLLVENLDRLSREDELTATHLFTGLILAGVRIVQLEPEAIFDRNADQLQIMRLVLEVGRAHAESARKSMRVAEAWTNRKRNAAKGGEPITAQCPRWLVVKDGKFEFRPGAKELVQRMFAMCRAGYGCRAIAAAFTAEKIKPWGKGIWEEAYIRLILDRRAAVGEHQPMKLQKAAAGERPKRVPDGDPIPDYFPPVISEKEWLEAQAAKRLRDKRGGRPPKDPAHVNPFTGILFDALTGTTLTVNGRTDRGNYYRILVNQGYKRHGDACNSFPLPTFEDAAFTWLLEVDAREILPQQGAGGNAVLELSGRLASIEGRLASVKAQLVDDDADVAGIMDAIRQLESRRKETADDLVTARMAAANPLAESWGDAVGIIGALKGSADQRAARLRLKSAVSRIVETIHCVFVKRGTYQLAAVQFWFKPGGVQRSLLIVHSKGRCDGGNPTPASWCHTGEAWAADADELDLRDPDDAKKVEAFLNRVDVPRLIEAIQVKGGDRDRPDKPAKRKPR